MIPEAGTAWAFPAGALLSMIKADVPIPLPHPRHYRMKAEPDFLDLKMRLTEEIREEAKKVA